MTVRSLSDSLNSSEGNDMREDTMKDVMEESTDKINQVILEIGELIKDIRDIRGELTKILTDSTSK